jgi:hypothetical protein
VTLLTDLCIVWTGWFAIAVGARLDAFCIVTRIVSFRLLVSKYHNGNIVKGGHKYTLLPHTPIGVGVRFWRCATCFVAHPAYCLVDTWGGGGRLFLGGKAVGSWSDLSPTSSAEVKNEWSYTCVLPCTFMVCTSTTMYVHKSENACICVSTSIAFHRQWSFCILRIPHRHVYLIAVWIWNTQETGYIN